MAEIFQYLVVFSLAVWTAKLAINKGRNGWVWGGAALILGLLPWHLIGVIPVLALMFIRTPVSPNTPTGVSSACARCNKSHSEGQHFCTGCGWDLNQTDVPEGFNEDQASVNQPDIATEVPSTAVTRVPDNTESLTSYPDPISEQEVVPTEDVRSEVISESSSETPQEDYVPWGTHEVGEAPTAAAMVTKGIERVSEGKFQEAIDQFTKAIALDSRYAEAWQRRSEAYARLGRSQQAEEDRRHLQGLDPSSSPS